MDALKGTWRIFRALVFSSVLVSILLGLFYLLGVALAVLLVPKSHGGILVATMCVFPAAGFIGMATDRAMIYSATAGILGIPWHAKRIIAAQVLCLLVFVGVPLLFVLRAGNDSLAPIAMICAGGALGSLAPRHRGGIFVAGIVVFVLAKGSPGLGPLLVNSSWIHVAAILASLFAFGYWLTLSPVVERRVAIQTMFLSDAAHEANDPDRGDDLAWHAQAKAQEPSSEVLAAGLAFSSAISKPAIATGCMLGLLAIAVRWRMAGVQGALTAYTVVAVVSAYILAIRVSTFYTAWTTRFSEQEILKLLPSWPNGNAFKRLLAITLLRLQVGSLVAMTFISVAAWLLDWIDAGRLVGGIAIMGAASLGASAFVLAAFVRAKHKDLQWTNVAIGLSCMIGAVILVFSESMSPTGLSVGLALVVAPFAIALASFSIRDLRFPGFRFLQ